MAEAPYRVEFAPRARRDLRALPESVAAACVELIMGDLAAEPRRVGKPLVYEPWQGYWSARRGDYRVIYRLDDESCMLQVVHIDQRGRVYRRR